MTKKLVRHGNSYALVIDKPILDLLKIDIDTPLTLSTDGHSLFISRADAEDEAKFREATAKAHKRFGRMLKRLSE